MLATTFKTKTLVYTGEFVITITSSEATIARMGTPWTRKLTSLDAQFVCRCASRKTKWDRPVTDREREEALAAFTGWAVRHADTLNTIA